VAKLVSDAPDFTPGLIRWGGGLKDKNRLAIRLLKHFRPQQGLIG
jgi:hypothetical protein